MAKTNVMITVDPDVLKTFDAIAGPRNRSPRIQELMEAEIERHMNMEVKLGKPDGEEQLKTEER